MNFVVRPQVGDIMPETRNEDPQLSKISPAVAILSAFLLGFILFTALDLCEQSFAPQMLPGTLRAWHFLRGLLAMSSGMLVVWYVMARKEAELVMLRDKILLQQREDFVAVINHRLRTPILANTRTISCLLNGDFGPIDDVKKKILQALLENNQDLDRLVRTLLDIYKLRNGNKELYMVAHDPSLSVQASLNKALDKAAARHIELKSEIKTVATIRCDVPTFEAALDHIVENAVRHARSSVVIRSAIDRDQYKLIVQDDGPGIAPEDLKTLFERFFLVSGQGKYAPVTGTGLCLCAEIAKAHGGNLECSSQLDDGSTFALSVPLLRAA